MKHDMHYRDCSASDPDSGIYRKEDYEPPASLGDLLVFLAALLGILLVLVLAS